MFKGFFLYLCLFNNKYKYIHESTLLSKLLKWNEIKRLQNIFLKYDILHFEMMTHNYK